jgi:hypothetical protein
MTKAERFIEHFALMLLVAGRWSLVVRLHSIAFYVKKQTAF